MFDQDIFSCLGSRDSMSLSGQQMSNQPSTPPSMPIHQVSTSKNAEKQFNNPEEDECKDMAFAEINFFPSSLQTTNDNVFLHDYSELPSKLEYSGETKSTMFLKKEKPQKLSNNMNDYIIKNCLKKMLSQEYSDLILFYCEQLKVSSEEFKSYWKAKMEELLPKHIGINRYEKLVKDRSPYMEVFKYFLTVYLQYDYLTYLLQSSIENKSAYIDCSIKLVYIAQVSKKKAYQLIQQAPNELNH